MGDMSLLQGLNFHDSGINVDKRLTVLLRVRFTTSVVASLTPPPLHRSPTFCRHHRSFSLLPNTFFMPLMSGPGEISRVMLTDHRIPHVWS